MSNAFRSVALFLSFAFGVIGMSVGINALVKSNDLKDFVKDNAPQGVTVSINTKDVFSSGAVLTIGCALLALTSFLSLLSTLLLPRGGARRSSFSSSRKPHLFLSLAHFFWALWIFASLVAYDVIARNRAAKITAFLTASGLALPDSAIQAQEQALGVTPVYWRHHYLKLLAILPWFAVLFGAIAGAALLRYSRASGAREDISRGAREDAAIAEVEVENGKASTEKRESSAGMRG